MPIDRPLSIDYSADIIDSKVVMYENCIDIVSIDGIYTIDSIDTIDSKVIGDDNNVYTKDTICSVCDYWMDTNETTACNIHIHLLNACNAYVDGRSHPYLHTYTTLLQISNSITTSCTIDTINTINSPIDIVTDFRGQLSLVSL